VTGKTASAWDAEYAHGRYRDEPPVDFVADILATANGHRLRSGVYIDVAFFDPADLSRRRDQGAEQRLHALAHDLSWEATNQAAVHTWYHHHFGGAPVEALTSVHDAVATWPETATAVAVRNTPEGFDVCAPHGLADLLAGVWRRNPTRVTIAASRARFARQRPAERWPSVMVLES
jgi:hypothetical protein